MSYLYKSYHIIYILISSSKSTNLTTSYHNLFFKLATIKFCFLICKFSIFQKKIIGPFNTYCTHVEKEYKISLHFFNFLFGIRAISSTGIIFWFSETTFSLNVNNFITLKLISINYPLWRVQALSLAGSQDLISHLTCETDPPSMYVDSISTQQPQTFTIAYIAWTKSDRCSVVGLQELQQKSLLALSLGLTQSKVCGLLSRKQMLRILKYTLQQELTYLHKDEESNLGEHLLCFKNLFDSLTAIGIPVLDKIKVLKLLISHGPKYDNFTITMLKPLRPSNSKFVSQLKWHEQRQMWCNSRQQLSQQIAFNGHSLKLDPQAFYGQRLHHLWQYYNASRGVTGFDSQGRGFQAHNHTATNFSNAGLSYMDVNVKSNSFETLHNTNNDNQDHKGLQQGV